MAELILINFAMLETVLSLPPFSPFIELSGWAVVGLILLLTHGTIAAVTIYLHRHQAHRALELHPLVSHVFRLWLWLTTGMITREWVAIHRRHHARCERAGDPHSPSVFGLPRVLWRGAELYRAAAGDTAMIAQYGHGTPEDWLERHLYSRHPSLGLTLMLVLDLALFGPIGLTIWAAQMIWIPLFAAGVINGLGHALGYRNFATADRSANIVPWGLLVGGEELHNNHHAYASSARLSSRWFEIDLGWVYIRALAVLRLAKVRKLAPRIRIVRDKAAVDLETLQAVITHRYWVAKRLAGSLRAACRGEMRLLRRAIKEGRLGLEMASLRVLQRWLSRDESWLAAADKDRLFAVLAASPLLQSLYNLRQDLAAIWERSVDSHEDLLARLQAWCARAETSGIAPLQHFAGQLRSYA